MSLRTRKPDAPSFPVLALGPDSLHLLQRRRQCLRAGRAGQQLIVMGGALETSWSLGGASTGPLSPRSFDPTARLPSARTGAAQLLTALTPGGEPRSLGMLSAKGSVPAL